MKNSADFDIFLATVPGLETVLCDEVRHKGFKRPVVTPGGVLIRGQWPEVWRANLWIRGCSRVLARIDTFHVTHLAQLDHRARRVPWAEVLRPDVPFRVEVSCTASRIYHERAAAERITRAINETIGAPSAEQDGVSIRVRIDHDVCTISVDTSGDLLHRRGHKEAVNRAPIRETMASLFLRQCGYDGNEPVVDPMCGSGTFILEAAEIAARLNPGRSRHFAFEKLLTFNPEEWERMRTVKSERIPSVRFYGSDRDAGAIAMSEANAERAGVSAFVSFQQAPISALTAPEGPPGLVIANPPYGTRIGDKKALIPLYRAFGQTLLERFSGWRVGIVTMETMLAQATGLPFLPPAAPVPHGGLRVTLFQTVPLP
ncbi:THUMP domain-containing class I SAM-dependent RNA methyltransferase [Acetobacter sp.]|uniref:THUMP domain-containing class I SAM-dependent RNA methyltransferase n=1 Tax=Acetobacter sp. TaxID=440 RepID=UPI0039E92596